MTGLGWQNRRMPSGLARLAGLAVLVLLAACGAGPSAPAQMIIAAYDPDTLVPVNPANPSGPAIRILKGQPEAGPSDMLMRLPKGPIPMHAHTHDYHLAVIEGQIRHWGLGGTEAEAPELGPGSYWFQPGGVAHAHACLSDTCLLFIHWAGSQDVWRVDPETGIRLG